MKRARIAGWLFLAAGWLLAGFGAAAEYAYDRAPEYVVWIEGEDAAETNFFPGESRYAWWHTYAPLSGRGLLELNAADFADAPDGYYARYRFAVPDAGDYHLYGRTRVGGYLASPYHVRIDDQPERRQPVEGAGMQSGCLAETINWKLGLFDLGVWTLAAGDHTLTVTVREPGGDYAGTFVLQGFDSFSLSRAEGVDRPETLPVLAAPAAAEFAVNPGATGYPGPHLEPAQRNWGLYERLQVRLRVDSAATEPFSGRLRCYYRDGEFKDVVVSVDPKEFGTVVERDIDLDAAFAGVLRNDIHRLWFYTFDQWYTQPAVYQISDLSLTLAGVRPGAPKLDLARLPPQAPPSLFHEGGGEAGDFVWNLPFVGGGGEPLPRPAPGPDVQEVAAGRLRGAWDRAGGFWRGLSADGAEMAAATAPAPFVRLVWLNGPTLDPAAGFVWTREGDAQVGRYRDDAAEVVLRLTPRPNADEIAVAYEITNRRTDGPIGEVALDILRGVRAERFGGDGELRVGVKPFRLQGLAPDNLLYAPSLLTHNQCAVYGGGRVLYAYLADDNRLDARANFGLAEDGVYCRFTLFPRIKPGETFTGTTLVVGTGTGDWKLAADRFRGWWESWAVAAAIPEWFQSIGGLTVGNPEDIAKMRERTGIRLGHTGDWLPKKTEGWFPDNYRLTPEYARDWRARVDAAHQRGERVSFYTNPLMFSRLIPEYRTLGLPFAAVEKDGFPIYTEHTHRHHPMALPVANAPYAGLYLDYLAPAIDALAPDVLYMDQLGAVPLHLDYAPDAKGNRHFGEWSRGQAEFCRVVVETLRKRHPELVFAIEGINVQALQYLTFALLADARNWEAFRYTFPRQYFSVGEYGDVPLDKLIEYAEIALLSGQPLIAMPVPEDAPADGLARLKALVEFKQEHDPQLYAATFRGLAVDTPELRVARYLDRDGRPLYVHVARRAVEADVDGRRLSFPRGHGLQRP